LQKKIKFVNGMFWLLSVCLIFLGIITSLIDETVEGFKSQGADSDVVNNIDFNPAALLITGVILFSICLIISKKYLKST